MNTSFSQMYRYQYRQWYTGHNFATSKVMELAMNKYGHAIAIRNAYRVLIACETVRKQMDIETEVTR